METYILQVQWVALPGDQRKKLRELFNMGITEDAKVFNDQIISDGVTQETLKMALNVETMTKFLNKTGTRDELWKLLVGYLNGETIIDSSSPVISHEEPKVEEIPIVPKKRGRPRKNG